MALKIVELIDDPERRLEMGTYGRNRVETELAWHHEAPNLLAAYERLWSDRKAELGNRSAHQSAVDRALVGQDFPE